MGRDYIGQMLDRGVAKVYAAARDPLTIDAADQRVIPFQLDVTDARSVAEAGGAAPDVSVLINNAGISRATTAILDSGRSRRDQWSYRRATCYVVAGTTSESASDLRK